MILEAWPLARTWRGRRAIPQEDREPHPSPALRERGRRCPAAPAIYGDWHDAGRGRAAHHAQDIFGPRGWPVLAPVSGRVVDVGQSERGGHYVRIRTRDGVVIYLAHLDAPSPLEEGQRVAVGELVGSVGNSGSRASSTCPHLHISARRGGQSLRLYEDLIALRSSALPEPSSSTTSTTSERVRAELERLPRRPGTWALAWILALLWGLTRRHT